MINKLPKYLAHIFKGKLRFLALAGIILLVITISTSSKNGEDPSLLNVISLLLFFNWMSLSMAIIMAVAYFRAESKPQISSLWVQITSSNWYCLLYTSPSPRDS